MKILTMKNIEVVMYYVCTPDLKYFNEKQLK